MSTIQYTGILKKLDTSGNIVELYPAAKGKVVSDQIVRTTSGVLEDSCEGGVKLHSISAVDDRQASTTGKNLAEVRMATVTNYGVTCTNNGDGTLTLNGTSTAVATFRIDQSVYNKADNVKSYKGTYRISLRDSNGNENPQDVRLNMMSFPDYASHLSSRSNPTATIDVTDCFLYIHIPEGVTVTNLVVYPQLEVGEEMTDWEPYTGGKPSPAPGEAVVTSANQLKLNGTTQTANGVTATFDMSNQFVYLSGDPTADAAFTIGTAKLEAGTYYANVILASQSEMNSVYDFAVTDADGIPLVEASGQTANITEQAAFTLTEAQTVTFGFKVPGGESIDNEFQFGITSSADADWDAYTVEYTESYPQEIEGTVLGKNLLDCTLVRATPTVSINGITFTASFDEGGYLQYIEANGTATANVDYSLDNTLVLPDDYDVILSGCPSGGSSSTYTLRISENVTWTPFYDYGSGVPYNTGQYGANTRVVLRIFKDYTANHLRFYPMIRPAEILDGTYVPYGMMRVYGVGKNLVESCESGTTSTNYGSLVKNMRVSLKKDVEYTVSVEITAEARAQLYWNNNSGVYSNKYFYVAAGTNRYSYTFTAKKDYEYADNISWLSKNNTETGVTVAAANVQIEIGGTATDYQPYTSQSILIPAPQQEFHAIGGVSDAITPEAMVKRFETKPFGGTWELVGTNDEGINVFKSSEYLSNRKNAKKVGFLCTHLEYKGTVLSSNTAVLNAQEGVAFLYYQDGKFYNTVYVCTSSASTPEELAVLLADVEFVYELASEVVTPLPTSDQIALHSLKSYPGVTRLYSDTYPQMVIDCEYGVNELAALTLDHDNVLAENELLRAEHESKLAELSETVSELAGLSTTMSNLTAKVNALETAMPYTVTINDTNKTIDFADK